jgi:hypothetical protein
MTNDKQGGLGVGTLMVLDPPATVPHEEIKLQVAEKIVKKKGFLVKQRFRMSSLRWAHQVALPTLHAAVGDGAHTHAVSDGDASYVLANLKKIIKRYFC